MTISTGSIGRLGTIMCIFAHPDDETCTAGGLLAAAAANGQKTIIVTATKGEGGVQDENRWPAAELGAIRTRELAQALKILGVSHHHVLDYADGSCEAADTTQAVRQIAELIKKYRPDSIFTFGPDGLTGHQDHRVVSGWATLARTAAGGQTAVYHAVLTPEQYEGFRSVDTKLNFFFAIETPPLCSPEETAVYIELDDQLFDKKIAALRAMPSQYASVFKRFSASDLRAGFGVEAFIEAS